MAKQLKSLNSKHRIMMHKLMLGERATDIAKELSMSDSTFSIIRNSPLFQAELDRLTRVSRYTLIKTSQDVAEIINAAAPDAARKIVELTECESENVALRASERILEYSDFGKEANINKNQPIVITNQQMVLIEEGMRE